ncbi:hypothetical protein [Dechloromonas sp. A34]|uniref:hypothetical protein n=1 Tax=Dechloromonas sp. A34 TaxID=447588 RepID=UPI002248C3ED|nr:hypothetical protein [Dechloromonas sp. A34]
MARPNLAGTVRLRLKDAPAFLLVVLVFFLVVSPVALVLRWLGRDTLGRRFLPGADSYWIARDPSRASKLRDQF